MDEDDLISDRADLFRAHTGSWLTVKIEDCITWDAWDDFAAISFPGWTVAGLILADE
mgnify:CR=1 FL=1|tara:strand:+ start:2738 stop:2908 length:171 start_codon:yes stop_codon:yes gene_type:complete